MSKYDVVYILRNGIEESQEELRYSLRSLENFPHGKVWFYGGKPDGLIPDEQVEIQQIGVTVWKKVWNTIKEVCKNPDVSEDFWLFNDDFFIMQPIENLPPLYDKTLLRRCREIEKKRKGISSLYSTKLMLLRQILMEQHCKTYNYATHTPLLINKKKALKVMREFPGESMFRSLYGNYWDIGGHDMKDCKIVKADIDPDPEAVLLSTSEKSFAEGKVGEFIRERFKEPCQYEEK